MEQVLYMSTYHRPSFNIYCIHMRNAMVSMLWRHITTRPLTRVRRESVFHPTFLRGSLGQARLILSQPNMDMMKEYVKRYPVFC